jgi:hypothetical protein
MPLAFDVHGGVVPTADEYLFSLVDSCSRWWTLPAARGGCGSQAHLRGSQAHRERVSHGWAVYILGEAYSVILNKWRTRLSVALHREVANPILAGAQNARRGERVCSAEGSRGGVHLFEPVRPVVGA